MRRRDETALCHGVVRWDAAVLLMAGLAAIQVAMPATAQQVEVEEFTLDNGMQFLLVPRSDQPNVVLASPESATSLNT
jgi:hypothetical protein